MGRGWGRGNVWRNACASIGKVGEGAEGVEGVGEREARFKARARA
jgi:hypothetical protein